MLTIALFIVFAGFVIGLGAVTVIDLHGFLGRHSPYWTEATIRTHKVTKPLIWIGILLVSIGVYLWYYFGGIEYIQMIVCIAVIGVLIFNGLFLSFYISPILLDRESAGRSREVLPATIQHAIIASFVVSFVGWWGLLLRVVYLLV